MIVGAVLIAFGLIALGSAVWLWRNATAVVADARRQLEGMFGEALPGVFDGPTDPLGPRIASGGAAAVGVVLLVCAGMAFATA
jgi:hypothetical protein